MWRIGLDDRGFWAIDDVGRIGPFQRKAEARSYTEKHKPRKVKADAKKAST